MDIETALRARTQSEVYFDPIHKQAYSVDASIFEITPIGVVVPRSKNDILEIIRIANEYEVSLIPRGAATGITGGCIGKGLIVDTSVHFKQLEIGKDFCLCGPGVVQDDLNKALKPHGFRLGPDTSTGNRATLGGMLANNAAGSHSLKYGTMADHVREVELALSDGSLVRIGVVDAQEWKAKSELPTREGEIYRALYQVQSKYGEEINNKFPHIPRRASGYNLDALTGEKNWNLARLVAGSEGTFGILTEIKMDLSPLPGLTGLCVIHFSDVQSGMEAIPFMLSFKPFALEMIDHFILEAGKTAPSMRDKLNWMHESPYMVFVAEFEGTDSTDLQNKLEGFKSQLEHRQIGYEYRIVTDREACSQIWEVRKAGLGLLLSKRSYARAIAFIEDLSVAPERLAPFMAEFLSYMKSIGKEAGIYGHVGSGCMHIRPYVDLRQDAEVAKLKQIMVDVSTLVQKYGGAMSGEHGDGFIRTWLNKKMFGDQLYEAFVLIKRAFDPENRMNPGKIVDGPDVTENLRLSPKTKIAAIDTFFPFKKEGGFALAVDLCNGNGACRKQEGVMCPSFQATGEEYDTTRARAQALRGIINGKLPKEDISSQAVHDVMDLCLQCKGCKTECPSEVDMAKMKSETLYHYHKRHGISLRTRLFGHLATWNKMALPGVYNWATGNYFVRWLLSKLGVTLERELPAMSKERFSEWFKKYSQKGGEKGSVVLFNDTYCEFNVPEIGQAAVKVLNAMGYQVIVPEWSCCGRPLISKGLLPEAKKAVNKVVNLLYALRELPIIGLEPSCILTFKDEIFDLVDDQEKAEVVSRACVTFDEFVNQQDFLIKASGEVKVHGHCHQKSIVGMKPTLGVLRKAGFTVEEINSGCCGMAGSFGYESEHYDLSMRIGELKLFPAVRNSDAAIVADGISCRTQIQHGTGKRAKHLAELLAEFL